METFFTDSLTLSPSLPPSPSSQTYREGQVADKDRDGALGGTCVEGVAVVADVLSHLLLQVIGVVLWMEQREGRVSELSNFHHA
jgi:hypothetical protein